MVSLRLGITTEFTATALENPRNYSALEELATFVSLGVLGDRAKLVVVKTGVPAFPVGVV